MEITLQRYTDEHELIWDEFIKNKKRNATFLHTRKFFLHNPLNQKDDASLLFYKNGKLKAVLPACLIQTKEKLIFHSHPRCTYGGFVVDESIGVEESIAIVAASVEFAKEQQADEIIIRNPFRIFHQMPSDETDYAMWYHGFTIKSRELECAIKLSADAEMRYEDSTRRSTKKAVKSVTVKETDQFEEYWDLLTINLKQKYNSEPTHNLQTFNELRSLLSAENIKLFGAFSNNRLIAGIVVFVYPPVAIHAQYIAYDLNFQNDRPLNAVINYIIKWGTQNNFQYFNLGMGNEEAGRVINYGLFRFKEGFGGRGVLRETMHLQLKN
jgi:hypothetical protein